MPNLSALNLAINILNIDLLTVGTFWRWQNINSPFSRLYYVVSGEGFVEIDGKNHHLTAGKMFLIPCFKFHSYHCSDKLEHYFVHFTSRIFAGIDLFAIQQCDYIIKAGEKQKQMFERLLQLNPNRKLQDLNPAKKSPQNIDLLTNFDISTFEKNLSGGNLSNIIESNGIVCQLLAEFLQTAHEIDKPEKFIAAKRLETVLEFIEKNYSKPIALEDMAKIIHLNPTYFSNNFEKLMGIRPMRYLIRKRIEKAQFLLLFTDKRLTEIAAQVGFEDANYFSRIFKNIIGVSPIQYRKAAIEQVKEYRK